jgi:dihydrofolate reductase
MGDLVYYVAATLDGYIAGPHGEAGFFPIGPDVMAAMNAELPETVPSRFRDLAGLADAPNRRFGTVLMGRATYQVALDEGSTSPYDHLHQVVFTRTPVVGDVPVTLVGTDPAGYVADLKKKSAQDLWLCGGGKLAGALLPEIDELIVKRYPVVAGTGIPLIDAPFAPATFSVAARLTFDSGVDVVTYTRS